MKVSNKILGALGILGSPFLFLEMHTNMRLHTFHAPVTGLFDLIYMLGWMCSVIALLRLQATGTKKSSTIILHIQLAFLCLANISSIWVTIEKPGTSTLYGVLDMFWPIRNVWMIVVGIMAARTGKLHEWRRYVVLAVGCWFPFCMTATMVLGKVDTVFYIGAVYSIFAWSLMGWAIITHEKNEEQSFRLAI